MPVKEGTAQSEFSPFDPSEFVSKFTEDTGLVLIGEDGAELPQFDQRYTEALDGLLFVGSLAKSFAWMGHRFLIRTLLQGEILSVPIVIRPWQGTVGEAKAYSTAMAASCVVTVDGKPLPTPIGETGDPHMWAQQRFDFVQQNWFQWTIDRVFSEYLALEAKVEEVMAAMGKALGPMGGWTPGSNAAFAGPSDRDSSEEADSAESSPTP